MAGCKDGTREHAAFRHYHQRRFCTKRLHNLPGAENFAGVCGVPGKANGIQAIFNAATGMNAAVCTIIDSTIGIPTHDSIETLVQPVVTGEIDFLALALSPSQIRRGYSYRSGLSTNPRSLRQKGASADLGEISLFRANS